MPNMLQNIGKQIPSTNKAAAEQAKAAQEILLRKQLGEFKPGTQPITRIAQAAAPQIVQAQATPTLQAAQQTQEQLSGLGQEALRQQEFTQGVDATRAEMGIQRYLATRELGVERDLANRETAARKRLTQQEIESTNRVQSIGMEVDNKLLSLDLNQREELNKIGNDVKGKILDARLAFENDELGRKFSNDRQLADFAAISAKNELEFKDRMLVMQQGYRKKAALLDICARKIREAIKRGYLTEQQKLDQNMTQMLVELEARAKEESAKAAAKARNNMMITQGIFTVGGAIVGGILSLPAGGIGAPAGAAIGAGIGQGVGSIAQGAFNPSY